MKAQTSEKIKIASKKQTRQTRGKYEIGEEVYYKRDTDEQLNRPVNVTQMNNGIDQ